MQKDISRNCFRFMDVQVLIMYITNSPFLNFYIIPKIFKDQFLDCLILEDETDRLSRNVNMELPPYAT